MKLAAKDRDSHETYCSSQTTACHLCQKLVPRNQFEIHLSLEHDVNPSLASGQRLIETQRLIDSLPLDASGEDLNAALKKSKLVKEESEMEQLRKEMGKYLCTEVPSEKETE